VDFVVLHTLHDKSKQVGLGPRMVCDILLSACFLISDKSTTTDIATVWQMIHRASTIIIQHAPRPRPQLTCAGPHSTANGVLGWAVSIKAGGRQLSFIAVPTPDTHTDREINLLCSVLKSCISDSSIICRPVSNLLAYSLKNPTVQTVKLYSSNVVWSRSFNKHFTEISCTRSHVYAD